MLSIGPYVVVREISTRNTGTAPDAAGKTYRATDRLTGIPVLLHPLATLTGIPQLPAHPALLPFTDIVVHAGEAYLVTELPANAVPARDPWQAARGALLALAALHEAGLAHGGVNTAQLWSVDGPVRLAGGGRSPLGGPLTVARDLHGLADALDDLGGLPAALGVLRGEAGQPNAAGPLTAREALHRLQAADAGLDSRPHAAAEEERGVRFQAALAPTGLPNRDPLSLLSPSAPRPQTPSYVNQAVLTSTQEPASTHTDADLPAPPPPLTFKLDISQWDVPDFSGPDLPAGNPNPPVATVAPPESASPAAAHTASLAWPAVSRPLQSVPAPEVTTQPDLTPPPPEEHPVTRHTRLVKDAASQALQRLKTDGARLRHLQEARRDEVAAQLGAEAGPVPSLEALTSADPPPPEPAETPQERRRREHAARLEEEALAAQLAQTRGCAPKPTPSSLSSSNLSPANLSPSAAPTRPPAPGTALPTRQTRAVKMRWDEKTNSWQKVQPAGTATPAARPAWLLPAALGLALLFGLAVWSLSRRASSAPVPAPAPAPAGRPQACCAVAFQVRGGSGRASISILNTTSTQPWQPGQAIGDIPGELHLPGPGTYKLNVTSEGFTPATVDVTVPATQPVTINLGQ